jgi:hypothetical protein
MLDKGEEQVVAEGEEENEEEEKEDKKGGEGVAGGVTSMKRDEDMTLNVFSSVTFLIL